MTVLNSNVRSVEKFANQEPGPPSNSTKKQKVKAMGDQMKELARAHLLNVGLPEEEVLKGWDSYFNFMISYGLKPWNPEDLAEAKSILIAFGKHREEEKKYRESEKQQRKM